MHKREFNFQSIGYIQSPYRDRFAVPRQPGLAAAIEGVIHFHPDPDIKLALKNLNEFSHIWVVFVFHDHGGKKWKPTIRPPRLGGEKKVGVLSSRSPHRPNPIGISVLKLIDVDIEGLKLTVSGLDVIDETPVLDIKPYIPYADSWPEANAGWASEAIMKYKIQWSEKALAELKTLDALNFDRNKIQIESVLELDPRPAFQKRKHPALDPQSIGLKYGFDISDIDVKYELTAAGFMIFLITKFLK